MLRILSGGDWSLDSLSLLTTEGLSLFAVFAAIILGWARMRAIAGIAWMAVFFIGFLNVLAASDVMGVWGFAFIATAFLGIVLQADLNPGHLTAELASEFRGGLAVPTQSIAATGEAAKKVAAIAASGAAAAMAAAPSKLSSSLRAAVKSAADKVNQGAPEGSAAVGAMKEPAP